MCGSALGDALDVPRGGSGVFLVATLAIDLPDADRQAVYDCSAACRIQSRPTSARSEAHELFALPLGGVRVRGRFAGGPPGRRAPRSGQRAWSSTEGRLNLAFLSGGVGLAVLAYARLVPADALRSLGVLDIFSGVLLPAVGSSDRGDWRLLTSGRGDRLARDRWSPLRQLGRTSLFIYWIHVEMVYGLISLPLHHALTLRQTWFALALFSPVHAGLLDRQGPRGRPAGDPAGNPIEESSSRSPSLPVIHYES